MENNKTGSTTPSWLSYLIESQDERVSEDVVKALEYVDLHFPKIPIPHYENSFQAGCLLAQDCLRFGAEKNTLAAALLFPSLQHHKSGQLKDKFNDSVYSLATGVVKTNQIDALQNISKSHFLNSESDNLRKMLLSIVSDVRVIFIKLIYCITTLKALKEEDEDTKTAYAKKVMHLYAPLANRLGLGQIKWELEDIAFRYLDPVNYFSISKSLKLKRIERENFIEEMKKTLSDLLADANIKNDDISGRVKHIFSIYKKITRKEVDFNAIFDTSALRILVSTVDDCYEALSIIHANWTPVTAEFDDYIANPKPNGYQSIHTAVTVPDKGCVEIQIRTRDMHDEAELGVAAHWKYKEGGNHTSSYSEKIDLLRQMLDWEKSVNNDNIDESHADIFGDRIYVFSPQEKVFDLAHNATALDFAYRVHTQVGHRCKGAKINGKLEPLTKTLQTGDTVEIMMGKEDCPSRDWLNPNLGYLNTSHALSKVKLFFRKKNYEKNLILGQQVWEKVCRKNNIPKNELEKWTDRFNFKTQNDLLASLGAGDIGASTILHSINFAKKTNEEATPPAATASSISVSPIPVKSSQFCIEGADNLLTQIALCCKPIPGDDITGYITKERGITIHKSNCRDLNHSRQKAPERIINVTWQNSEMGAFIVDLAIEANDRKGLLNDITNELKKSSVTLVGINSFIDQAKSIAYINLTLSTQNNSELRQLKKAISGVADVVNVQRK